MSPTIYSAAVALAAATLVRGDNVSPVVPEDAQIGLLHFPITCKLLGALNQTFDTVFTATAPVFGGSGQQIYYTDVVGTVVIPQAITDLAPLVGATQASAAVTAQLKLTNAFPPFLQAYKDTINNITFSAGKDAAIRIPPGSGTLPPLGPVALGVGGQAHRIFLGEIDVDVTLEDSTGRSVLGPIPVNCGQQDIDFVIGSVDVNSTTGLPPYSPSNGFVSTFPDTPELYESGAFRFPYDCQFGPLGPQVVDLTIQGTIGTYFRPGEQFFLSNSNSFLRIPQSLVDLAKKAYPSVATFDTTITDFDLEFTNANPAIYNVASTQIESNIAVSDNLVIPIPKTGTLNVGPITAGSDGTIVGVAVGNATASAVLRDDAGNALFTLPITCSPPAPLELIGVPISTQAIGNYTLGTAQQQQLLNIGTPSTSGSTTSTTAAGFSFPSFFKA